jgi:hypothetical protein
MKDRLSKVEQIHVVNVSWDLKAAKVN